MRILFSFLKKWTLPVAITIGIGLYALFTRLPALVPAGVALGTWVDWIFPFTVFLTLWTTFCKVDFNTHALRPASWSWALISIQFVFAVLFTVWALLSQGDTRLIATGALACTLAPCATAAPVVTAKLGGSINKMTAHVLLSSLMATATIPVCATTLASNDVGESSAIWDSALSIFGRVATVLALPLVLGWGVRYMFPPLHRWVVRHRNLPFYLWSIVLAITSGVTVRAFDHTHLSSPTLLAMAASSLFICLTQFAIGRRIGLRCATSKQEKPSVSFANASRAEGGQALGQKNTALIIWATTVFLHPAAALAPGCYVLWQNIVNSLQLHRHAQAGTA